MEKKYNKPILRSIWYYIYKNKGNCILGITGRVRKGKSHFAVKLGNDLDSKFSIGESIVYTVEELIERTLGFVKLKGKALSLEGIQKIPNVREWLRANIQSIRIKPGRVIIFDEAGTGAYVREFFSKDNKTISKVVQMWAFLRILVIIVVPEDLRLAESTLTRFMNIEVKMLGIDYEKNHAKCIAWTHIGWNKKTKEPIKRRVKGCKYGGIIYVNPLDPQIAEEYENISRAYKLHGIINMGRQFHVDKVGNIASTKTIWDDIQYVKEHLDEFKNEKGKITVPMIRSKLGVSVHKAQEIRTHIINPSTMSVR